MGRPRRSGLLISPLVVALDVAGCGDDDDTGAADTNGGPTTGEAPAGEVDVE